MMIKDITLKPKQKDEHTLSIKDTKDGDIVIATGTNILYRTQAVNDLKYLAPILFSVCCIFLKLRSVGVVAYMLLSGGVSPFYSGKSLFSPETEKHFHICGISWHLIFLSIFAMLCM